MSAEDRLRSSLSRRATDVNPGPEGIRLIEARLTPAPAVAPVSRWRWFGLGALTSAAMALVVVAVLGGLNLGDRSAPVGTAGSPEVDGGDASELVPSDGDNDPAGEESVDVDTDPDTEAGLNEGGDQASDSDDTSDSDGVEDGDLLSTDAVDDKNDVGDEGDSDGGDGDSDEPDAPSCSRPTEDRVLEPGESLVTVFLGCEATGRVVSRTRVSPGDDSLYALADALMQPADAAELEQGLFSPFTQGAGVYVDGAWIEGGRAIVNFNAGAPDTFGAELSTTEQKDRALRSLRETVFTLPEALELELRLGNDCGEFAKWFELSTEEGCILWTRDAATPGGAEILGRPAVVVRGEPLNVRSDPGVGNEVVAQLDAGQVGVRVLGEPIIVSGSPWFPVLTPGGTQGWVNGLFLGVVPAVQVTDAEVADPIRQAAAALRNFTFDANQSAIAVSSKGLYVGLPGGNSRQHPINLVDPGGWRTAQNWPISGGLEVDGQSLLAVLALDQVDESVLANAPITRSEGPPGFASLPSITLPRSDGASTTLVFDFTNGTPELLAAQIQPAQ